MNYATLTQSTSRVTELLEKYGALKSQKAVLLCGSHYNNVEVLRLSNDIAKLRDELIQIVKHLESNAVNSAGAVRTADKTCQICNPSGKKSVMTAYR